MPLWWSAGMLLNRDVTAREQIDGPADRVSFEDYQAAFLAIAWTNRNLGGTAVMLGELNFMVQQHRLSSISLLDVGCGGGDIDEAILRWSRGKNIGCTILGIDVHPHAVRLARDRLGSQAEINVRHNDFFEAKFTEGSFDIVIASLLLHHLSVDQLSYFLWKAYRIARVGVILTDLRRSLPAYWFCRTGLRWMAPPSSVFTHDSAVSFRRSYTLDEIRRFLTAGGYPYMARIPWRAPFRLVLTAEHLTVQP